MTSTSFLCRVDHLRATASLNGEGLAVMVQGSDLPSAGPELVKGIMCSIWIGYKFVFPRKSWKVMLGRGFPPRPQIIIRKWMEKGIVCIELRGNFRKIHILKRVV